MSNPDLLNDSATPLLIPDDTPEHASSATKRTSGASSDKPGESLTQTSSSAETPSSSSNTHSPGSVGFTSQTPEDLESDGFEAIRGQLRMMGSSTSDDGGVSPKLGVPTIEMQRLSIVSQQRVSSVSPQQESEADLEPLMNVAKVVIRNRDTDSDVGFTRIIHQHVISECINKTAEEERIGDPIFVVGEPLPPESILQTAFCCALRPAQQNLQFEVINYRIPQDILKFVVVPQGLLHLPCNYRVMKIIDRNARVIGKVEGREGYRSFIHADFRVKDIDDKIIFDIEVRRDDPIKQTRKFLIFHRNSTGPQHIGEITQPRIEDEARPNIQSFYISFPQNLDLTKKVLLLAAGYFIKSVAFCSNDDSISSYDIPSAVSHNIFMPTTSEETAGPSGAVHQQNNDDDTTSEPVDIS